MGDDRQALDIVDDPEMRQLASEHFPRDIWSGSGALLGVYCDVCHQEWPCATTKALKESDNNRGSNS